MYKRYFEEYVPYQPPSAFNRIQPLPPVSKNELHGQLLDWASQYLMSKKFPLNLITILLKRIKSEFDELDVEPCRIKEEENQNEENKGVPWYHSLEVKQKVIDQIDKVCYNLAKEYRAEEFNVKFDQPFHEINCASLKNNRRTLEDRFAVFPSMEYVFDMLPVSVHYFAVFDGHNGVEAANYAAAQLHLNLIGLDSFPEDVPKSIIEACHTTDQEFLQNCLMTDHKGGTTLALVLIVQNRIFVAWVGDSQVAVIRGSTGVDSVVNPHKPGRLDEIERITAVGGEVTRYDSSDSWRVNGCLAVSRAIGDAEFKKYVISTPDIVELELDGTEEYAVLATDGLWDEVPAQKCHEFVISYLVSKRTQEGLCIALAEEARMKGSSDNTTIVVVFLQPVQDLISKYTEEYGVTAGDITEPLQDLGISEPEAHTPDSVSSTNENTSTPEENSLSSGCAI